MAKKKKEVKEEMVFVPSLGKTITVSEYEAFLEKTTIVINSDIKEKKDGKTDR